MKFIVMPFAGSDDWFIDESGDDVTIVACSYVSDSLSYVIPNGQNVTVEDIPEKLKGDGFFGELIRQGLINGKCVCFKG